MLAGAKKIQFACIKITGGGQTEFFENALLHLFNFTEFLMSTDFVGLLPILIASWNLAVPSGGNPLKCKERPGL